uniref:Uncharacterized protein n=1 Tax=Rhizophora mucronata TaxID=61149 RepID=A0A2P2MKQ4_RHIMU
MHQLRKCRWTGPDSASNRRGRLLVAKQAPPSPTDSGKYIDTAQISKAFFGRLTPWGPFSPSFSRVLSHSGMGVLSTFPAYSGKLHLLPFLLLLFHLLCFLPQRFVVHNGLFARFWTRAKDRVSNPGCTLSCIN